MINKKLLMDCMSFEISRDVINEAMKKNGPFLVKGTLQRADAKNQNGRIYPKHILEREAKNYEQHFIRERRALGELDHPESSIVNLKNVSHTVTRMFWEGDDEFICLFSNAMSIPACLSLISPFISATNS